MGPMMRFGASGRQQHICDDENTEEAHLCVAVNAAEERRGFWVDTIIQGKRERSTPGHFMPSSRPIVATNDRCSFARRTPRNEEHKKNKAGGAE